MYRRNAHIPFGREKNEQHHVDSVHGDFIRSACDPHVRVNDSVMYFQRPLADLHYAEEQHQYDYPSRESHFLDTVPLSIKARIGKEPRMFDETEMRHVTPEDLIPGRLVYYWNDSDCGDGGRTLYLACVVNPAGTIVTRLSDGDLYMDTVNVREDLYIDTAHE